MMAHLTQMKLMIILMLLAVAVPVSGQTIDNQAASYNFPKLKSGIAMPVEIPLPEISNIINASVKELIYEDDSYTDNNNDQFKAKVWKTRPIRLVSGTQQNLLIEVPLKIWAEKGIGTLGLYTYQHTTFETVMSFSTTISLKNNWTIATTTEPNGFRWVTKPTLDFGRIQIPITPIVEKNLKEQQEKFSKTIDGQIANQLNFSQYAAMAWNALSQPFLISEEYDTWLKVSPVSTKLTPLKFYKDRIDTSIGIDVYSETFTGSRPTASEPVKTAPGFTLVPALADRFRIQTTTNIPFTEATRIAQNMFLDKEFEIQGSAAKIKDIRVYGVADRVMMEAQTEGYVNGKVFISGIPVYDEGKKKIVLSETKFNLRTANILQKTASLLFRKKIVKMIEEEYGIPTQDIEETSRKSIEEALNKEYYKGIKMSGKVFSLKPSQILLNPYGITAVIDTDANLHLLLSGI